jgi:fumarate reductase subunit D
LLPKQTLFEVLDWALFSFGGIVTSFLLPATIVITLVLQRPLPDGILSSFPFLPWANLYLFVFLGFASWHAMHRIRFILYGFGLSHYRRGVTALTTAALALILVWAFRAIFLP